MGNAQSTSTAAGHHNRLSKPKTNTNSLCLSPGSVADSPVSTSSRYVDLSARGRQQIKEQLLSPIETDFDCGISVDGDTGPGGESVPQVQRRFSTLSRSTSRPASRSNSRSNSLSCFGSRQNSTTKLTSLPGSKISLVSNTQAIDLETAIKILQEVRKSASPEELEALHDALEVPANPVLNAPDQGLSRRTSVINRSSSSLTRRRSLVATPGLATRNSSVEGHRRTWNSWKAPKLDPQDEAKWRRQIMVDNMPLARFAGLGLVEDGRDSPIPRARTPGDLDYSHLGALRLGSLVVTNGAASPAPSARHRRFPAEEDDYFASEEGSSPLMMKTTRRRGHTRSKSAVSATTPPLYRNLRVSGEERLAKTMSRYDRSRKDGAQQPQQHQVFYADFEPEPMKRLRVINKSVDTLSRADINEKLDNPSEDEHGRSSEDHDEGFALDDLQATRRAVERMFDGTIFSEPAPMPETFASDRTAPKAEKSLAKQKKKRSERRPPPKKADSGYSSGGSLRNRDSQKGTVPTLSQPTPSQPAPSAEVADTLLSGGSSDSEAISLYTFEQMLQRPVSQKPLPDIPLDEDVGPRPPSLKIPQSDSESQGSHGLLSPKSPVSVISKFSLESTASSQKRLQKRCPSFQELPVVQSCQPIPEGTIPNVPKSVRAKFSRRLSETPGMECLTRTYPSKDHVNADQSTIASNTVAPMENPLPFPTPEPANLESTRPATPPRGNRRSLSLFRRRSAIEKRKEENREDENTSASIVNLGTIASALGRSPYDAAKPDIPEMLVTPPTHPHQISNALPRARSMVSMDSRTAAEFARMRSKDLALARPEMPRRPSSYHDLNLEAGEAIAFKRRPRSSYRDTPPVPSIEASNVTFVNASVVEQQQLEEASSGSKFRTRSTGRGPVVSELVDRYDHYGGQVTHQQPDWSAHSYVWNLRRRSVEAGLRPQFEVSSSPDQHRSQPEPPEAVPGNGYTGWEVDNRYERGCESCGGAGRRQLHSYADPRSMHWRNQVFA